MTHLRAHQPLRICALALALLLGACAPSSPDYTAHDIQGVLPDLSFTLTDAQGQTVTASHYRGDLVLLYFGYTHCPDICPATMARVRTALAALPDKQRKHIDVLFVSVDPKRDDLKRLRQWTAHFGPEFIGLTGTQKQLRTTTKRYHVTYGYGQPNARGFYTVSHSTALYVFDPQGKARLLVRQGETIDQLTSDLKTLVATTGVTPRQ